MADAALLAPWAFWSAQHALSLFLAVLGVLLGLTAGFSFPSGHSSGSVVAYGMLAYLSLRLLPVRWHLPSLLAMVALALTVGASRLFLGVHFASDVMAGFASGIAWLALCITSIEYIRWRDRQTA